ncbi:MAG: DeoR family transcriptional regulator [Candidatus Omnitrophica bacterium]|nr:DeoR family transcriptional regulator [Candidatus Omnitrophota bacterium]MBU1869568.1 DeoR family transcriptional regulator [Candidatus Omnitrophota bacterium]
MVRTVDYESRSKAVLTATINKYIKDAEPVASEDLAKEFGLSSATIRNIFSKLEEAGYITHPYTSGGRIPTVKGYRYYVDFLLSQMELLDDEKTRVVKEYKREMKRLEDALEKTSEVITAITQYAGIVSFLEWEDRLFYKGMSRILEQPEFQDIEKMRLVINMVEEKQNLLNIINRDANEKVKIYIGGELECPQIQNCSLVVSSYRVKNKLSGRLAVLGPMRMEYNHIIPSLEYISGVLTQVLEDI